jgi:hypothetical protein
MYNRFIPKGGFDIGSTWVIHYEDIADHPDLAIKIKDFFEKDKDYENLKSFTKNIPHGTTFGRRYGAFGWRDSSLIGAALWWEYLDNPHGYGKGDFFLTKLILPEYRWTRESRLLSTNILDIFLLGNIMKRTYSYVPVFKEGEDWDIWGRVDERVPCWGKMYPTDGPTVQPYMSVKKVFKVKGVDVLLVERDGDIFRKMDLVTYFMKTPVNTKVESVRRFISSQEKALELIQNEIKRNENS